MFRTLYGAPEAAFHLELEYEGSTVSVAPAAPPAAALLVPSTGLRLSRSTGSLTTPSALAPTAKPTSPAAAIAAASSAKPPPAPRFELDWTQSDDEAAVLARLSKGTAAALALHNAPRVVLTLTIGDAPDAGPSAAGGPAISASAWEAGPRVGVSLKVVTSPPPLRSVTFSRTSGSGTASEAIVGAVMRELDTRTVRRLRLCDGLGPLVTSVWAGEPRRWGELRSLVLSGCGLSVLPPAIGDLPQLMVLRLSNNKLTALPPDIGRCCELEVLAADNNQITSVPPELHHCTALRELDLSANKISRLVLDPRALTRLEGLQLWGNPLEYLPELAPARRLRSLSLANVRILSDAAFTRFEVELGAPAATSYSAMVLGGVGVGGGGHKLAPLFQLLFRRSTVQHPLLAGGLARLCEDPSNLDLLSKEDVALQQLVAMSIGDDPLVVGPACSMLRALAALPGTAPRLVKSNAVRAVGVLVGSPKPEFQIAGLEVLSSIARGASDRDLDKADRLAPTALVDRMLSLARSPAPGPSAPHVQCACLAALAALSYDATNRRMFLQSPGLMALLTELAAAKPAVADSTDAVSTSAVTTTTHTASSSSSAAAWARRRSSGGTPGVDGSSKTGSGVLPPVRVGGSPIGPSPRGSETGGTPPEGSPRDSVARVAASVTGAGSGGGALLAELGRRGQGPGSKGSAAGGGGSSGLVAAQTDRCDPRLYAIRLLAVLGQNEQVRIALGRSPIGRLRRGVRVLSMDGGGMKGMAMVELLRQIERRAGRPIWQLFDVIGGTSTGALLAVALGILRLSLDACNDLYTMLGRRVFNQSAIIAEEAGWKDSLYKLYATGSHSVRFAVYGFKHDAAPYEGLLREYCRLKPLGCIDDAMIDSAVLGGPYVFATATLASAKPAVPFVFRNYELPSEVDPLASSIRACPGSSRHDVWQAVRASSAAPYFLDDYTCPHGARFQDGATTANNPAVVALQQARLLHPDLPIDVVVSLGCGAEPQQSRERGVHSMMDTGSVLVEAAVSTDRADEALSTVLPLVPGLKYYRFCAEDPRCAMQLDDVSPEAWRRLLAATTEYCAQPLVAARFDELAAMLTADTVAPAGAARLLERGSMVTVNGLGSSGDPAGAAVMQELDAPQAHSGGDGLQAAASLLTHADPPLLHHHHQPGGDAVGAAAKRGVVVPVLPPHGAPAPRLGTARGIILVEAPRSGFPEAAGPTEAAAAAVSRLPQLLRRCDLTAVAAATAAEQGTTTVAQQQQQQQQQQSSPRTPPPAFTSRLQLGAPRAGAASSDPGILGQQATPDVSTTLPGKPAHVQQNQQQQPVAASNAGTSGSPSQGSPGWLGMFLFPRKDAPGASSSPTASAADSPITTEAHTSVPGAAVAAPGQQAVSVAPPDATFAPPHQLQIATPQRQAQQYSRTQQQGRLVSAASDALRAAAGGVGVVHLALREDAVGHLVGAWDSRVIAVVEPGEEAAQLMREWASSTAADAKPAKDLTELLSGRPCLELGGGILLSVLGQQRVRTPQGRLVTSWLLQRTEPSVDAVLEPSLLLPLATQAPRAVIVSTATLPPGTVHALLRAGARAVVSAVQPVPPDFDGSSSSSTGTRNACDAAETFFRVFYTSLVEAGATVPEALAAAEAAAPALCGVFACHYL